MPRLIGPVARAAGADIDCRRDHPYAAYDRVDFDVITERGCDVWSRVVVRMKEVFESIRIIRQCLEKMEEGPLQLPLKDELPVGQFGAVVGRGAARGEPSLRDHRREQPATPLAGARADLPEPPGVPMMIKDQQLADMTISLGSIDPCFSCTDRLETIDLKSGAARVWSQEELIKLVRARKI